MQPGRLMWIGLRIARLGPVEAVDTAELDPGQGLVGDRYAGRTGTRQVTIIQYEHLAAIGAYLGQNPTDPARLRRNLVVAGINLLALRDQTLRIGTALLKVTGQCHPCSRMEEELGVGGYNAVRGQGGLTARVVQGGTVRVGDTVERER
jgi:MOSC domain-containing protein YiiM